MKMSESRHHQGCVSTSIHSAVFHVKLTDSPITPVVSKFTLTGLALVVIQRNTGSKRSDDVHAKARV